MTDKGKIHRKRFTCIKGLTFGAFSGYDSSIGRQEAGLGNKSFRMRIQNCSRMMRHKKDHYLECTI